MGHAADLLAPSRSVHRSAPDLRLANLIDELIRVMSDGGVEYRFGVIVARMSEHLTLAGEYKARPLDIGPHDLRVDSMQTVRDWRDVLLTRWIGDVIHD